MENNNSQAEMFDEFIPIEIPIVFNDMNLGEVTIDFRPEIKEKLSEKLSEEKEGLIKDVKIELKKLKKYIEKDIEIRLKTNLALEKRSSSIVFIETYRLIFCTFEKEEPDYIDTMTKDDEVFNLIKKEGPIILSSSLIQSKFKEWQFNKDTYGLKINKVRDCLIGHALKSKYALLPTGRPKNKLIEELGSQGIKAMYQDISLIMKVIKKNRKKDADKPLEIRMDNVFHELRSSLEDKANKITLKYLHQLVTFSLFSGAIHYANENPIRSLAKVIENDNRIQQYFYSYHWQPNELAIEIMAVLLDASESAVKNIVHRSQK